MENISLTSDSQTEFWHVKENFEVLGKASSGDPPSFLQPVYKNNEDELFVRGQTAVWSRGIPMDNNSVAFKSFSMDAPIKFAFFCPKNFLKQNFKYRRFDAKNERKSSFWGGGDPEEEHTGISLVDATSIRTYMKNGEDFLAALEFPVSGIWLLNSCVLFERDASTTTIDAGLSIAMPRLFSLRHPLEEMAPVLIKYGEFLGYFSNSEHKIIFTDDTLDLMLLYDLKSGRHFIAKLRKATEEEVNYVGESSEQNTTELFGNTTTSHMMNPGGSFMLNPNHSQRQNATRRMNMTSGGAGGLAANKSTFHSTSYHQATPQGANRSSARFQSPLVTSHINSNNISKAVQSPLTRLQSSIRQNSFSMIDARNYGQAEPSQPIFPDFCLETLWMEEIQVDRMLEPASKGFYHTDWIGERYLCFLLPMQGRLYLVEMDKEGKGSFGAVDAIEVKEAVCLEVRS